MDLSAGLRGGDMDFNIELKKLTIANRLCNNWLRLHPHAYMDYGRPGIKMDEYHNTRAFLMQRVEDYDNHKYVVMFDKETKEAVLLDRLEYLADFDRLYEMYD